MIENIAEIETGLGLKEGTLKDAIASEEAVKLEVPKGKIVDPDTHQILSNEDFEARINNVKAENKTAGLEIAIKEKRGELGYEFEGKTLDNLLKAHGDKVLSDAGTEPDKKILELEADKATLQGKSVTLQDKIDELLLSNTQKDAQRQIETNILSGIPDNLTLSKEQVMTLFLADYSVENDNGKQIVKKGGETLKNESTLDPLVLGDVLKSYSETFVKPVEGGAGGGSTIGDPKGGSMALFTKEMNDAGHTTGSEHFNRTMQKRMADGSLK